MSDSTRLGLIALAGAMVAGVLGDLLIRAFPVGLNVLLWVTALVAGLLIIARLGRQALNGEGRWLLAGAVLFATGLTGRGAPLLQFLDVLAIGICLGLAAMTTRGGSLSRSPVTGYLLGLILSGVNHMIGPLQLLFVDIKWEEVPRTTWSSRLAAVGRGLLIGVPLLLLFGVLFVAADAIFEQMVTRLFDWSIGPLIGHVVLSLALAALAAGFYHTVLRREPRDLPGVDRPSSVALGGVELGIVLGLLNLLFLAFVLVQVRYLFGGADLVLASAGLTYAEYARRGFFELVQVSALVLPVLLGLHWLIPAEHVKEQRLFRWLGGSLVLMLFVIMGSAMQRMFLYQQEYGLTELRLYTTAFMGWMALLFAWFLWTVLRGQRERFAIGAMVTGFAVLAVLHMMSPDLLILRTNLDLRAQTGRFDAEYAAGLGPDAAPALVAALPDLSPEEQAIVRERLGPRWQELTETDWRSWNWGYARARAALGSLGLPSAE